MTATLLAILISMMQVDGFPEPTRFKSASNKELSDFPGVDNKQLFDEISPLANERNNNNKFLKHEKEKLSIPPLTGNKSDDPDNSNAGYDDGSDDDDYNVYHDYN